MRVEEMMREIQMLVEQEMHWEKETRWQKELKALIDSWCQGLRQAQEAPVPKVLAMQQKAGMVLRHREPCQ